MTQALMAGKRGLIMGLANDKSIAWGIAKALSAAGAELAFSYQGDALKKRVVYEPVEIEPRVLVPRVLRNDSRYKTDDIDLEAEARAEGEANEAGGGS